MPSSALSVKESSSWAESTGQGRAASSRGLVATVIATIAVTFAIAIPLVLIANRADPPATSEGLVLLTGETPLVLEGASLRRADLGVVALEAPELSAVAFVLYLGDQDLATGEVSGGPRFELVDLAERALNPGTYDLLVNGTTAEGRTTRFAASFTIEAPE